MPKRNRDLKNLHPVLREIIEYGSRRLKNENNSLRLFEGFRTHQLQAYLSSKDRTRVNSSKAINGKPWQSLHQLVKPDLVAITKYAL